MKAASAKSCPSCGERYDVDVLFCPRDGTPLASARTPSLTSMERDPYLGIELAGQIKLKHLIGIGSMGRVYSAFQGGIERDVAVKVLHRELSGNPELVSRFHREAKVASRLVHPNVVQVLMTGALPQAGDPRAGGELYLVMEYLDGISLLSALAAAGTGGESAALPLPRALHIALQICDAVGEAHAQGIVHRDLKPENVMMVRRGDDPDYVKVLDFGIARFDWADRGDLATQAGLIFGTAKYISPEGAEGQPVGPPADVYSIATIIYQMLAGRTPFEGDSPVALLVQHTHAPPTELRSIARASYVPAPLSAVIMANLVKKPGERAANARLFGRDLIAAARQSGLYPEEIAAQSTLFSPSNHGAVKLASKERTKALDLSPELAARISGIAAQAAAPRTETTLRSEEPPPAAEVKPAPPSPPEEKISEPAKTARSLDDHEADALRDGTPSTTVPGAPAMQAEDLFFAEGDAGVKAPHGSTIQGTETTLEAEAPRIGPRRARLSRIFAIVACALVAMPIAIVGGRRLGGFGASAASDAIDVTLDEARDAMNRHAWDAPPGHNFKEITAQAMARWPDNAKILDLRREAAERLVSDALGSKYAGNLPDALRLVRLALEWNPQLTTAQHLAAELASGGHGPDVAPVPSGSAGSSEHGSVKGGRKSGRDGKGSEPRVVEPTTTAAPKGAPPPATVQSGAGAVLPPSPLPPDHPPPASTGPWL